jgi:uncharacterized protein (UPF0212 family)
MDDDNISRELSQARLDSYLETQLELHSCPICMELMSVEHHEAPVLLFPCGRTFCKVCVEQSSNTCPLCRSKIQSKATNYSLQQTIQSLSQKKRDMSTEEAGTYG